MTRPMIGMSAAMTESARQLGRPSTTNNADLVSVVIPAYNSAAYIAEAIDSVLAQDYPTLEIIVIDDGSTDDTVGIVTRFGDRIRLLTQTNQGSAAARNLGIRAARGKYIAFLDADDVWWKHKISLQIAALSEGGYRMAYSRFIYWHADAAGHHRPADAQFTAPANPQISTCALVTGWLYPELLLDCIVWTSTVVAEKTALEAVGLFDESLRKGQDYDLWLKLSRQVQMVGLDHPTALYRMHPASITGSVKPVNYEYLILSRAVGLWGEAGPDGRKHGKGMVAARLAKSSFGHGYAHFKHGDARVAAASFMQSMRHSGMLRRTFFFWVLARLRVLLSR